MSLPEFRGIAPLPLRVPSIPGETAHSLLRRLAARNHFASVNELKTRVIGLQRISRFSWRQTIALVAILNKSDPAALSQYTPNLNSGACHIRGFSIPTKASTSHLRICVRCVAEDCSGYPKKAWGIRTYVRDWWHLDQLSYCPKHQIMLSINCSGCGIKHTNQVLDFSQCRCGLTIFEQDPGAPMQLESFVRQEFFHFLLNTKVIKSDFGFPAMHQKVKLQLLARLGHALSNRMSDCDGASFGVRDQYNAFKALIKYDRDIDRLMQTVIASAATNLNFESGPNRFIRWLLAQPNNYFLKWQSDAGALYHGPLTTLLSDAVWADQERRVTI